jgi:hypothetical protein
MAKYHIQHMQQFGDSLKVVYYRGNNYWTTEHEHRKIYDKKADATAELYDFGGMPIKDTGYNPDGYNPDAKDGDGDGIVQEGTEFERTL